MPKTLSMIKYQGIVSPTPHHHLCSDTKPCPFYDDSMDKVRSKWHHCEVIWIT